MKNITRSPVALGLATLLVLTTSACTSRQRKPDGEAEGAAPFYHRFYQGYRLDSANPGAFEEIINTQFLPLFPQAHPAGLYSYRPALPAPQKGCGVLPAEIALLTFESEATYGAYRETEIGKKIRDAHTPVFNPETSKSLVPGAYAGAVEVGRAYATNPGFAAYREAHSALVVHCGLKPKADVAAALPKAYDSGSAARNILFTASPQHLVEYVFTDSPIDAAALLKERKDRLSSVYRKSVLIPLAKMKIGDQRVKAGQGFDAQW